MPIITWGLVACFAAVTLLSWRYFFMAPVVFSSVITLCLGFAAWAASRS
jgi:hypothetical protein